MSFLVGPVNYMGHPFTNLHEVPREFRIGEHLVYAFGGNWLFNGPKIVPAEPFEAILLWDPGWLRNGVKPHGMFGEVKDEIAQMRVLADEHDVSLFGLASDWFATWGAGGATGMHGMMSAFKSLDGVVIDPVGAAALRSTMPPDLKFDHTDYRFREIIELSGYLHAGRLPTMGVERPPKVPSYRERSIDVSIISNIYPGLVVHRAYYIEAARRICQRHGWSFVHRSRVRPEEMEEIYLDSKVVLNIALGTQNNCRVYEALVCGAYLVTDDHNIDRDGAPGASFHGIYQLEQALVSGMTAPQAIQARGRAWAINRSPERQWAKILDALKPAIENTRHARREREIWQRHMEEKAASAPLTNDGRPVILV